MTHPEQDLQIAVCEWLDLVLDPNLARYCHVPNGGKRSKVEAAKLKKMGVKAGVVDLLIEWHCAAQSDNDFGYLDHGWIELKAGGGKLSAAQDDFLTCTSDWGGHAALCRSLEEVAKTLKAWRVPIRGGVHV